MSMLMPPWPIPVVGGNAYRIDFLPTSTATLPVLADDTVSTASYFNNLTSSGPASQPEPESAPRRVGRPDRGKRTTVKAARRAARRSR